MTMIEYDEGDRVDHKEYGYGAVSLAEPVERPGYGRYIIVRFDKTGYQVVRPDELTPVTTGTEFRPDTRVTSGSDPRLGTVLATTRQGSIIVEYDDGGVAFTTVGFLTLIEPGTAPAEVPA